MNMVFGVREYLQYNVLYVCQQFKLVGVSGLSTITAELIEFLGQLTVEERNKIIKPYPELQHKECIVIDFHENVPPAIQYLIVRELAKDCIVITEVRGGDYQVLDGCGCVPVGTPAPRELFQENLSEDKKGGKK